MIHLDSRKERRGGRRRALLAAAALAWGPIAAVQAGCADLLVPQNEPQIDCEAGGEGCEEVAPAACTADMANRCAGEQQVCLEGACQAIVELAAGGETTCALSSGGRVLCWGLNADGQCGQAPSQGQGFGWKVTPVRVELPEGVEAVHIAVGGDDEHGHACAVTLDGQLWCWGDNRLHQAGYSLHGEAWLSPRTVPLPPGVSRVEHVRAGPGRTCIVAARDGEVERRAWCRGGAATQPAADWEELQDPSSPFGLPDVTDVAPGIAHTCILTSGRVFCQGSGAPAMKEIEVSGVSTFRGIAVGGRRACAATGAEAYCWDNEQCVDADLPCAHERIEVPSAAQIEGSPEVYRALFMGSAQHACMIGSGGDVACWTWEAAGGAGDVQYERVRPRDAVKLALGSHHACVRVTGGDVQCWGKNEHGQLGHGNVSPGEEEPRPVKWYEDAD